jgi:hypothetical protein
MWPCLHQHHHHHLGLLCPARPSLSQHARSPGECDGHPACSYWPPHSTIVNLLLARPPNIYDPVCSADGGSRLLQCSLHSWPMRFNLMCTLPGEERDARSAQQTGRLITASREHVHHLHGAAARIVSLVRRPPRVPRAPHRAFHTRRSCVYAVHFCLGVPTSMLDSFSMQKEYCNSDGRTQDVSCRSVRG